MLQKINAFAVSEKNSVLNCWKTAPPPTRKPNGLSIIVFIKANLESIPTLPAYCLHGVMVHLQDNKTSDLYYITDKTHFRSSQCSIVCNLIELHEYFEDKSNGHNTSLNRMCYCKSRTEIIRHNLI